ncbi:GlsB/YeaQ/YmgE family stress response membrane protein [Nissabacter sp. SGAir0207]|uniref:GlsB/YeaQ/YmgE family stress response membrane protein n=1 Tax=Nissabacter sp. SGAir0207 TaxID=2126321 RepID=UPI0010CCE94C|nr:GlsB/YeaQ/YmgE family stress response membrane protein [Nissabacter sp. SGAir0207]QCR36871.1 GlsB/YeaQ/YmgE family stress response membrane protein [Nissabacter sp. SGAir0207]
MGLISWIIMGLVVGLLAKVLMPGKNDGSVVLWVVLAISGALVGGYVSTYLDAGTVAGFSFRSLLIALTGAILILFVSRKRNY